jgi:hypothetical protein
LKNLDISLSWSVFLSKFKKANSYHQIEEDSANGLLDDLANQAIEDYKVGRSRKL